MLIIVYLWVLYLKVSLLVCKILGSDFISLSNVTYYPIVMWNDAPVQKYDDTFIFLISELVGLHGYPKDFFFSSFSQQSCSFTRINLSLGPSGLIFPSRLCTLTEYNVNSFVFLLVKSYRKVLFG